MKNCEQKTLWSNFHYHGNNMIHIMKICTKNHSHYHQLVALIVRGSTNGYENCETFNWDLRWDFQLKSSHPMFIMLELTLGHFSEDQVPSLFPFLVTNKDLDITSKLLGKTKGEKAVFPLHLLVLFSKQNPH